MNERIRTFERESHIDVYALGLDRVKWEATLEKFVDMIVRECAQVADAERPSVLGCGYITKTTGMRIKEHFGVEELKK
jgi:hypothetical protein